MPRTHYFPTEQVHYTWDTGHEPVLTVADGDTVVFETRDVSDNQITRDADASVIAGLDWDRVYPLAGPVRVEGAAPGDTLAVEILDLHTKGWGWTAIIPGFGLLPEDFPDAYVRIFDLSEGDVTYFRDDIVIPLIEFTQMIVDVFLISRRRRPIRQRARPPAHPLDRLVGHAPSRAEVVLRAAWFRSTRPRRPGLAAILPTWPRKQAPQAHRQ